MNTWGSWSLGASWAWHDAWLVRTFLFTDVGVRMLMAGPLRITVAWPVPLSGGDMHETAEDGVPFRFAGCTA